MKLIPTESIPTRRARHYLQDLIAEFIAGDADIVRVEFSDRDYKSVAVCASCLRVAVKKSGSPVNVIKRDSEVFLSKFK